MNNIIVTDITDQHQQAVDQFADYIIDIVNRSRNCSRYDIPLTTVLNDSKQLLKQTILQRLPRCRVDTTDDDRITVWPAQQQLHAVVVDDNIARA